MDQTFLYICVYIYISQCCIVPNLHNIFLKLEPFCWYIGRWIETKCSTLYCLWNKARIFFNLREKRKKKVIISFKKNSIVVLFPFKKYGRTSLVTQWLRIRLPMQGTRVRALVPEDPTCRRATKPTTTVGHNYWTSALEPTSHNYWSPRA